MGHQAYSLSGAGPFDVDAIVRHARRAQQDGFASYWIGQQFDWDAFSLLAVLTREVPHIEFGTAVTHIWTAFPVHLAQQAASLNVLSGGRFTLGLGVEHDWVMREMWGLPFQRPVSVLSEYLQIITSMLRTGAVEFRGEHYQVNTGFLRFEPMPGLPIILGALGPRMLELAGRHADGTTTWMTGRRTLRDHIVPTITRAASESGRPPPRIIALLPVLATDDREEVRREVLAKFGTYHQMPSYRAMLEREGVGTADEIAICGSEGQIQDHLGKLARSGVTDLGAIILGDPDTRERGWELLCTHAQVSATGDPDVTVGQLPSA